MPLKVIGNIFKVIMSSGLSVSVRGSEGMCINTFLTGTLLSKTWLWAHKKETEGFFHEVNFLISFQTMPPW